MMQLGFVSAILPDDSLEQVFETASRLGYDCVELMCWPEGGSARRYAGVTHVNVSENEDTVRGQVHQLSDKHGVNVSGLGYYPNPLSPNEEESSIAVGHLRRVIEIAAAVGLSNVNTFVGRNPTKSVDENWQPFLDCWGPLIEHAEKCNVKVGIENCPMSFTRDEWPGGKNLAISPSIWRRMFQDIPSRSFGLNYDPSHLVWQQIDWIAPLAEFGDRIFHVHAKDVRIDQVRLNDVGIFAYPNEYHLPKLPGFGEIDWGNSLRLWGKPDTAAPYASKLKTECMNRHARVVNWL